MTRKTSRGGRDQDRWRKIEARIRLRKWMKPKLFVNGLAVEYETLKAKNHKQAMECCYGDLFPPGSITFTLNPDCDFVKGGE
jgi:hypothetical protein